MLCQAREYTTLDIYLPNCLGQEAAKGLFGLRVKAATCLSHPMEASLSIFNAERREAVNTDFSLI